MKRKIVQIIPSDIKSKWDKTPQRSRVYDVSAGLVPSLCKELADFKILITGEPKTRRGRKMTEKSNCLMAQENTNFMRNEGNREIMLHGEKVKVLGIRRLTPTECARLQTIPTWYKWACSDSQAYRMLGNGWTVEVIKHFFKELPKEWFA